VDAATRARRPRGQLGPHRRAVLPSRSPSLPTLTRRPIAPPTAPHAPPVPLTRLGRLARGAPLGALQIRAHAE
jgi:hypothetical protein